jgi:DNA-binding IclR family transcriptional regulator
MDCRTIQLGLHIVSLITPRGPQGRSAIIRIKRPSERRSLSRSAARAVDLLEHFGEARRPLRAIEIARLLDIQPSTAAQLLKTMVDFGHLVFNARKKTYLPSPRLIGFSNWMTETYDADKGLRDLVRDVQSRTGAIVTLTTPNDLFMQVIDLAFPAGQQSERGLRISLFGSAIGSAHLSTLADDELMRLADRARVAPSELPAMRDIIASIRKTGFADGPTADGSMWSIAASLPDSAPDMGHQIPLVLGLAGPRADVVERLGALQDIMREAIARWTVSPSKDQA